MWQTLRNRAQKNKKRKIISLFDTSNRAAQFSITHDGLYFDYSKTNIDEAMRCDLIALADSMNWTDKRDAMFRGEKINVTENRSVLHTALRRDENETPLVVDGIDVMQKVIQTRKAMLDFATQVRAGRFQGQGGQIKDVVQIGIGGSDLGPAMAYAALASYVDGPRCHFVSNVDGAHIHDILLGLNPQTTLVIVASKTFTTIETMTNADTAFKWMAKSVTNPANQFVALSSNLEKTAQMGIDPSRVFGFENWVGGRYSVWGPIGLALAIAIGPQEFEEFLHGARAMDLHFCTAAGADNMPLMLALVGVFHGQICGYETRAVLPYAQRLHLLPAYLQQLEMESNGKSVQMNGTPLSMPSGPIVWGAPGTNGQHAFYQLIHQGTRIIPCEFMLAQHGDAPDLAHHHQLLQANCLAQSEALMIGRSYAQASAIAQKQGDTDQERHRQAQHRVFEGNRPSTTLIYSKLMPYVLGQILALYEHRVFVEGVLLGINSFDQWGVELGKELATALTPMLEQRNSADGKDGSTQALIKILRGLK